MRMKGTADRTSDEPQQTEATAGALHIPSFRRQLDIQALDERESALSENAARALAECRRALTDFEYDHARTCFNEAVSTFRLSQHVVALKTAAPHEEAGESIHLVHSACLYEVYRELIKSTNEAIAYVIGSRVGSIVTMERSVILPLDSSSRGHANANPEFCRKLLVECERFGTVLAAYFHTHPGKGAANTQPSDIDLTTQAEKEAGGYPTIGGIFSRDGYLRFFTDQMEFHVHVLGKEIEHEGRNLFRLTTT